MQLLGLGLYLAGVGMIALSIEVCCR
ncbi:MAG: hypothetical protein JWP89_7130, partial [Schlesneria sp.]|nr:hypothetical protein [Schlesneria sp.]